MAILAALLVVLTTALAALYVFFRRKYQYWSKVGIPHTDPSFPFGDTSGMGSNATFGEVISKIYKRFTNERFVGFWMLYRPCLLIRDPELVKNIFVRDFMSFHDRGIYVNEEIDPLAGHLFSLAGSKWRNLRVKMTPTFTSGKMKLMFPILIETSKHLKSVIDAEASKSNVIEVKEFAARYTTDIISLCAFGIETDSLHDEKSEFRHYGLKALEPTMKNVIRGLIQFMSPDFAAFINMRTVDLDIEKFFMKVIKESMEFRETNKVKRNDFLELLIQLKNNGRLEDVDGEKSDAKEVKKFTIEEAAAQAFVFFIAGFETSSTTMQFALYELAKNEDKQQKAREEIKKVLAKYNGEITYDGISEMDYLSRAIDETLRMYPPVPFLQRESNKDYSIPDSDVTIPKKTLAIIDVLGLHHDSKHFPNPERFDPDRFLEQEKAKRHHYAYLPFGEGPRNCIGMRFGLMQTKVGMATLLSNFKFSICNESPVPMKFDPKSFILSPKLGMRLKVEKL